MLLAMSSSCNSSPSVFFKYAGVATVTSRRMSFVRGAGVEEDRERVALFFKRLLVGSLVSTSFGAFLWRLVVDLECPREWSFCLDDDLEELRSSVDLAGDVEFSFSLVCVFFFVDFFSSAISEEVSKLP